MKRVGAASDAVWSLLLACFRLSYPSPQHTAEKRAEKRRASCSSGAARLPFFGHIGTDLHPEEARLFAVGRL